MPGKEGSPLIEKGIWIQEKNGVLTMGTLDRDNGEEVVLPEKLSETIFALEDEMMDALYGESAVPFDPEFIDVKLLFEKLIKVFETKDVKINCHCPDGSRFSGNWNELYDLMCAFIHHSFAYELKNVSLKSIHINASVVDGNFCLIYRDSGDMQHTDELREQFDYIRNNLNGEVSIKSGSGKGSYLDILIPGKKQS